MENISIPFDKPALLNEAKRRNGSAPRDHKWGHAQRATRAGRTASVQAVGVFVAYIYVVEVHAQALSKIWD